MKPIYNLAVPLGPRQGEKRSLEQIADRVRMVLDTRPGVLPWRDNFGCDLGATVGESITDASIAMIRWRIQEALHLWVPEVQVKGIQVSLIRDQDMGIDFADRRIPIAEAALVRFGVQSSIQVRLDLETNEGALMLQASLSE